MIFSKNNKNSNFLYNYKVIYALTAFLKKKKINSLIKTYELNKL